MIRLNKPKFWDKKNISFISVLLIPITLLTLLAIVLKKKFSKTNFFKIPTICVGNIYFGGTGKTPVSILIAKELFKLGQKPALLRKYYRGHNDEFDLIEHNFKDLIINNNRTDGIIDAEKKGYSTVILDDGLQDYKIKKDLKIVCFHQNQLIGNGLVIPSGPLRETLSALKEVDIVLINGKKNVIFEQKILKYNKNLEIFYFSFKPIITDDLKNYKLFALAAIGNPENFFKLLKENNLRVEKEVIFPDHYEFTKKEMQDICEKAKKENLQVIMTEKDYFKIKKYNFNEIRYLKISVEIKEKDKFFNKINRLYEKNT